MDAAERPGLAETPPPPLLAPETSSPKTSASPAAAPPPAVDPEFDDRPRPHERLNFVLLAVYQILLRTGWIFKTESVIMPAVLDSLSGATWMRACLPLLNRLGQSVPPLLIAGPLHRARRQKWWFVCSTMAMALVFALLTCIWIVPGWEQAAWAPHLYLALYGVFFSAIGVNGLVLNTLQGKLIRTTRRGLQLLVANVLGAVSAIGAAVALLPLWLRSDSADFASIFGFSTALFVASSALAWFLREEPDGAAAESGAETPPWTDALAGTWAALRRDANFRNLCLVTAAFGSSMLLFPHYQAIGLGELGLDWTQLAWWVIVQNVGTGLFSIPAGPLADWRGNRIVIQLLLVGLTLAPCLALWLSRDPALGRTWYHYIFLLVGLTPVGMKTLANYTLEIAPPDERPRYLSTMNLCMAAPIFLSPLAGLLIDAFGFQALYAAVAAVLVVGVLLSLTLSEPRRQRRQAAAGN